MYTWLGWVLPPTILTYSLHRAQNDGNSFTVPENLSNDPDISFNPVLSVNGTHVYVEWTDQDDNGLTELESKTLPTSVGSQNNAESHADLSGDLNSTISSSALLQGQNSTDVRGNESTTEIQIGNMTGSVTLNRSTLVSNWDPSSLISNSNYSLNSQLRTFGHYDHSGIKSR